MTIPRFEVCREFDGRAASHWMDKWTGAVLRRSGGMRDRETGVRLQRLELSQQNYESISLQSGKIKRSLNV
jgi:hypothetical protein